MLTIVFTIISTITSIIPLVTNVVTFAIFVFLTIIYLIRKYIKLFRSAAQAKGPRAWPIIGNALEFVFRSPPGEYLC